MEPTTTVKELYIWCLFCFHNTFVEGSDAFQDDRCDLQSRLYPYSELTDLKYIRNEVYCGRKNEMFPFIASVHPFTFLILHYG